MASFALAVDRNRKQGGEKEADFIRILTFGKTAELCSRYLAKGRQAAVQGRIQTGSYTKQDGTKVYTTDVIADRVEFLGGGQSGGRQGFGPAPQSEASDIPEGFHAYVEEEDEIPF